MKKLLVLIGILYWNYSIAQNQAEDSAFHKSKLSEKQYSIWLGFNIGTQYFRFTDDSYL